MTSSGKASLQALFVTFLWFTSWVLIMFGLGAIPPVTFAGLRYFLAFLLLLPLLTQQRLRQEILALSARSWRMLLLLGLVYYTFTQGAQFVGLVYLPANMLSLMLTLSGITIALFGRLFLGERLSGLQWVGVFVSVAGAVLYFGGVEALSMAGLAVGLFAIAANSAGALLGRGINRRAEISPLAVTMVSMGVGSVLLLLAGVVSEPFPALTARDWGIILWLAAVNTAFAFTLWNRTLQTLSAAQSSVINNTMLIQIAILAWIFLGERPGAWQLLGLLIAAVGTVMMQLKPRRAPAAD